ncbi:MAG: sigma-70 family RNA polymerase sigma factor [Butyrivibrio sp.]|jgi:RNA polymerase sigma-70 factor (ECF subfamily)|nr:sigma-70 family RNA polymerase sigma factor [Butyrivibrio sp.]
MYDYEQIYREYDKKVLNYIRTRVSNLQDAEDIHTDVFTKVLQNLNTFDESKASISTWIYTIAHNKVIDFYRVNHESLPLELDTLGEAEPSYEENMGDDTLDILADALAKLSEKDRSIIILSYYGDYTLKETAEKMGISYNSCKMHHKAALEQLKGLLAGQI